MKRRNSARRGACAAIAALWLAAGGSSAFAQNDGVTRNQDIWGYAPFEGGGQARSCARPSENAEKACVVVFCRADGAFLLGLHTPPSSKFIDDQPGAVVFGDASRDVQWRLEEGPEAGKPLWISSLADVDAFTQQLVAALEIRLRIGADDGPEEYAFPMASAELALALLRRRCEVISKS